MELDEFCRYIRQKGEELYRTMPWREDTRPYYVLVSELMLQQTQVARVIPKFEAFIAAFPDEQTLASASLADVLAHWQGLGYNRRAKFLHEAAKKIVENGRFPETVEAMIKLPGVGKNTAGAIAAYSFNQPVVYVETNIRTVIMHHFFAENDTVDDKQIIEILDSVLDKKHPREFYWALMDYGSWLKQNGVKNNAMSRHYKKQSPLQGSVRQVRGKIIEALVVVRTLPEGELRAIVEADERYEVALVGLIRDGLVVRHEGSLELTKH